MLTRYSQKTEHLEQPLHTNRSQINTSMFCHVVKTLERETVHGPSQIATWTIYYAKEIKLHELLIIDQLAKDPLCSLNRYHRPIRC